MRFKEIPLCVCVAAFILFPVTVAAQAPASDGHMDDMHGEEVEAVILDGPGDGHTDHDHGEAAPAPVVLDGPGDGHTDHDHSGGGGAGLTVTVNVTWWALLLGSVLLIVALSFGVLKYLHVPLRNKKKAKNDTPASK
jgi:hypothetical protein